MKCIYAVGVSDLISEYWSLSKQQITNSAQIKSQYQKKMAYRCYQMHCITQSMCSLFVNAFNEAEGCACVSQLCFTSSKCFFFLSSSVVDVLRVNADDDLNCLWCAPKNKTIRGL